MLSATLGGCDGIRKIRRRSNAICLLPGSVTSCCDSQGCGIRITLPAAEPETLLDLFCSPLRGRTFQASTSRLISTLSSSLGANVEKYRRKLVDLDLINFRFWIRLGARWRPWVFGWKGDLCFRFDYSRKQWKKEIHLSSIAESYLNLRIMRSKERRRIY